MTLSSKDCVNSRVEMKQLGGLKEVRAISISNPLWKGYAKLIRESSIIDAVLALVLLLKFREINLTLLAMALNSREFVKIMK